jgi:hypothetical protein
MGQMLPTDTHNRVADRTEIVDQRETIEAEPPADHRRPNDPGIVGELQHFARDRAGYGDGSIARQSAPQLITESRPCGLQACMLDSPERDSVAEVRDLAVLDVGKRKPSMASPDVSHHQFH